MEDDLKKIMQPKTIKNKRVVAPLQVTLYFSSYASKDIFVYIYIWLTPQTRSQPWNRKRAQSMVPNTSQVAKPEAKETKPILNNESENKLSDVGYNIMATIKFKCTADKCTFVYDELVPDLATELRRLHHEANHAVCGAPSGQRDKLQKLDRPVLTTGYSQQDFRFFREEWRRYATGSNATDENLLRDQLLQCAELSLRRMLQNTIGSANIATISVAGL